MIDFVGTTPFLRIALLVAMATMRFHQYLQNSELHVSKMTSSNTEKRLTIEKIFFPKGF